MNDADAIRRTFDAATLAAFGAAWLVLVWYLRRRQHRSATYLALFTVFYVYLFTVVDYTLLQFQSLLVLRHFIPTLHLQGLPGAESVNFVPLVGLDRGDMRTSLLNVLMTIPFGLGLPFIARLRWTRVIVAGAAFSILIELMQFVSGAIGGMTFRVADINDVIFNTLGAAIGVALFVAVRPFTATLMPDGLAPLAPRKQDLPAPPAPRR